MYNNNDIAQRIKAIAKEKGITIKVLLDKCNLNINYLSEYAKGQDMSTKNFFKICDCLEVSIDSLLGRTDYSNIENNIVGSNNNVNSNNTNSNNSNCNNTIFEPDIVSAYMSLKTQDKLEIQLDIMKRANDNK